ncbi:hypothetical protein GCM10028813_42250 [Ramlibacter alkalitolerans]
MLLPRSYVTSALPLPPVLTAGDSWAPDRLAVKVSELEDMEFIIPQPASPSVTSVAAAAVRRKPERVLIMFPFVVFWGSA